MQPSFLDSEYEPSLPEKAYFHVIPVPYEATVSYGGGTAQGPAALLEASRQLEDWDGISAPCEGGVYTAPAVDCTGSVHDVLGRIEQAVAHSLDCGALPVLLGGEHTVSLGALRALAGAGGEPFGIVQIDAHADLRHEYEGSPFSHACVMCRAVKDLSLPLAQFACRDFSREEVRTREEYGVIAFDAAAIAKNGIPDKPLPDSFPRRLYLSFDVDGLDSSLMPATGTPSPGGLGWFEALQVLERCISGRTVVGCDVVELAPIAGLHHADFTAAKLTHALMGMAKRANDAAE